MRSKILENIASSLDGIGFISEVSYDGLVINKIDISKKDDIDLISAKVTDIINGIIKIGKLKEIMIGFEDKQILVKTFDEYFIFIELKKDANIGKARLILNQIKEVD
jgi:predicted regulator of Ras-like GTPase activity (Roadblock/LC7/MglB family)